MEQNMIYGWCACLFVQFDEKSRTHECINSKGTKKTRVYIKRHYAAFKCRQRALNSVKVHFVNGQIWSNKALNIKFDSMKWKMILIYCVKYINEPLHCKTIQENH